MTAERWIVVRNWEKFQHYRDRDPTWIKLFTRLSGDPDWEGLTFAQRGVLVGVWIEYARRSGVVSESSLRRSLVAHGSDARYFRGHLETLIQAGFLEVSASRPLAIRYGSATAEKEKSRERLPKGFTGKSKNGEPAELTSRTEARSVECPNCGAEPGDPCVGPAGVRESCHVERHALAVERGARPIPTAAVVRATEERKKTEVSERHAELVARARREISTWGETRTDLLHERLDALESEVGAILSDQERSDVIDEFLASVWDETVFTDMGAVSISYHEPDDAT